MQLEQKLQVRLEKSTEKRKSDWRLSKVFFFIPQQDPEVS